MLGTETVAELPGNGWDPETQGAIPVMKVFLGVGAVNLQTRARSSFWAKSPVAFPRNGDGVLHLGRREAVDVA